MSALQRALADSRSLNQGARWKCTQIAARQQPARVECAPRVFEFCTRFDSVSRQYCYTRLYTWLCSTRTTEQTDIKNMEQEMANNLTWSCLSTRWKTDNPYTVGGTPALFGAKPVSAYRRPCFLWEKTFTNSEIQSICRFMLYKL